MILGLARSYCLACPKTRVARTASIILSFALEIPYACCCTLISFIYLDLATDLLRF